MSAANLDATLWKTKKSSTFTITVMTYIFKFCTKICCLRPFLLLKECPTTVLSIQIIYHSLHGKLIHPFIIKKNKIDKIVDDKLFWVSVWSLIFECPFDENIQLHLKKKKYNKNIVTQLMLLCCRSQA